MVKIGICERSMNSINFASDSSVSRSSPMMMPEVTSRPWRFRVSMASSIGKDALWALSMPVKTSDSGVSIPTKTVRKPASRISARMSICFAIFSVASQANCSGYPRRFCQSIKMRQQIARRFAVADEIVVDQIDHRRMVRLGDEGVEFGKKLLGRLEARLAAIEGRNVAKLAPIWAAAGELERADEIARERDGIVKRKRKARQR